MEKLENQWRNQGVTLHSSQAARLKPPPVRTGAFEDLGSGFKRSSSQSLQKKSGQSRKLTPSRATDLDSDSDGLDDLDCLSQKSEADAVIVVEEKRNKERRSDYHPETISKKSQILKGMKIPKNKSTTGSEKPKPSPSPSPPAKAKNKAKTPRYRSDIENDSDEYGGVRENVRKKKDSPPKIDTLPTTKPRPRPKPRPLTKPTAPLVEEDESLSIDPTPTKKSITRTPSAFPPLSPLTETNIANRKRPSPSPNTIISPNSSLSSSHSPPSRSSKAVPSRSAPRLPAALPISPLNSPDHKRSKVATSKSLPAMSPLSKDKVLKRFPAPSPVGKAAPKPVASKPKPKDKGKRKAGALAPFPMCTQDFRDISSIDDEPGSSKRYARKRRHRLIDEASAVVEDMDIYEEEDSLFMSPAVDPKTLCPYCDTSLPPSPTPFLVNLLASARLKSQPDPRSTNPLGRKAPLSAFASVCQRHDFESEVLPEAEAKRWPKTIDWEALGARIAKMKFDLENIIRDSGEADLQAMINNEGDGTGGDFMTSFACKGPRIQCVFWREAMKSIMKRGARAMTDVRGQFLDFEKSQPGYYGELGSIIIQQTLLNMFPLDFFDPKTISPFTANEFIQRILVPEVALRLIMEDRKLKGLIGAETALQVLRDSTAYGVTMFPEDSGEGTGAKSTEKTGGVGVGDRIVMERARKRRKEIEEGGEIEALFDDDKGSEIESEKEGKRRGPGNGQLDDAVESDSLDWGERKSQKKKSSAGNRDRAISINSSSDRSDSEKNDHKHDSNARPRPRRNTKTVESSEDEENAWKTRPRHRERSPSLDGGKCSQSSRSRTRDISSSFPAWDSPKAQKVLDSKAQLLNLSEMDICSDDDSSEARHGSKTKSNPVKTPTASRKKPSRSQSKQSESGSDVIVDVDVNTPMPKRRLPVRDEDEATPKPITRKSSATTLPQSQRTQSVLALARARKPSNAVDGNAPSNKSKKPKTKLSNPQDPWLFNMRSELPDNAYSSNESESASEIEEAKLSPDSGKKTKKDKGKGKRDENFRWLLDDPTSQEIETSRNRPGRAY
ncbi:hypothetical protein AN958_08318 [Leucoagaricus sp. SymC.cos]|nr:hypothetical protein AN958_08318 [Leucoagaricus sp. SymC.cos]